MRFGRYAMALGWLAAVVILIGCGAVPEHGPWDVLINLTDEVPEFFSQFHRLAELVAADEASRNAGRERFRYYRDRGYELHTHNV